MMKKTTNKFSVSPPFESDLPRNRSVKMKKKRMSKYLEGLLRKNRWDSYVPIDRNILIIIKELLEG